MLYNPRFLGCTANGEWGHRWSMRDFSVVETHRCDTASTAEILTIGFSPSMVNVTLGNTMVSAAWLYARSLACTSKSLFLIGGLVTSPLVSMWLVNFSLPGSSWLEYAVPTFFCYSISLSMSTAGYLSRFVLAVPSVWIFHSVPSASCLMKGRWATSKSSSGTFTCHIGSSLRHGLTSAIFLKPHAFRV